MTDAINSNNRIKAPNQALQQGSRKPASHKSSEATNTSVSSVVELSSGKLMDQLGQLPEIDQNRIDSIKSALANGDYQPDPQLIAKKFAAIEKLLP